MKQFAINRLRYKIALFLFTLLFSLTLFFVNTVYVNRQGIFSDAAFNGNVERMKLITLLGIDVDSPGCESSTCPAPIVLAAWYGENEAVLYLLNHGADINNKRNWGKTALMMAAFGEKEETVNLLISKGADVNLRDEVFGDEDEYLGETALDWAKLKSNIKIIHILQDAGAK